VGKPRRQRQAGRQAVSTVNRSLSEPPAVNVGFTAVGFSGPLPPPSILARYDEVVPGAANRILTMAEQQSAHRRDLEHAVVTSNVKLAARGQQLTFVLAMVALVGGFYLVSIDKDAEGIGSIVTAVAGLVGVFLWGRWQERKERDEKQQQLLSRNTRH
jgi:uncharacterized membrane protein